MKLEAFTATYHEDTTVCAEVQVSRKHSKTAAPARWFRGNCCLGTSTYVMYVDCDGHVQCSRQHGQVSFARVHAIRIAQAQSEVHAEVDATANP